MLPFTQGFPLFYAMTKCPVMLIADDAPMNRLMLRKIFGADYTFLEAGDGLETLRILQERDDIAIILLDLRMPHMDGFGVLQHLKEEPRLADIPVIVNTAETDEQNEVESLQLGAVDFIGKPYNPEIVRQRVKSILQKRELDAIRMENSRLKEQARTRELLEYHATHDALTGIYNRGAFYEKTAAMLRAHPEEEYVLLRWDIERFKVINELFGMQMGDRLLKGTADHLREQMRGYGTYGRLEADHFVVCFPARLLDAEDVVRRLDAGYATYHLNYNIVSNVGIYLIDDINMPIDLMCDRANLALRTVKGNYIKRYAFYDDELRNAMLMEQRLCSEMNDALMQGQFHVYLQPIYDISTNTPVSAEALVRWQHPVRGLVPPNKFIPLFERNGFITKLDVYIWEEVCRYLHDSLRQGQYITPISVNISRLNFYNPRLCSIFINLVKKYDIPPRMLKLEITESAYTENPRQLLETMKVLQQYGFEVLMDDFGSGYFSLNMLKDVPVDILKVDMRFLEDLEESRRAGSVLTSVVRMAKWLEMRVVAEGVETQNQLNFLRSIGCDMVQGYYFSKPITQEAFSALMKKQEKIAPPPSPPLEKIDFNALWNSTHEVNLLFNEMIDCIGIYELSNNCLEVIRVNDGYYRLFSVSPQSLFEGNHNVLERIHPEDCSLLLRACRKAEQIACAQRVYVRRMDEHGNAVWLNLTIRHIGKKINQSLFYFAMSMLMPPDALNAAESAASSGAEPVRILVVDDNLATRAIVRETFRGETVLEAQNGKEAVQILESDPSVSLVLLDLEMPEMDGFALLEYLRRSPALHDVPVVVMSQHDEEENELRALQLGATDFIEKPLRPQIVQQRVRNVLHKCEVDHMRVEQILMRQERERTHQEIVSTLREQACESNQQLQRLKNLYASMPCGIVDFSRAVPFRVLDFNDAALAAFGHAERKGFELVLVGGFFNGIYEADRPLLEQAMTQCLEADKGVACTVRVLRGDGSRGCLAGTVTPSQMLDGRLSYQYAFLDVSVLQAQEKELQRGRVFRSVLREATDMLIFEYDCAADTLYLSRPDGHGGNEETTLSRYVRGKLAGRLISPRSRETYLRTLEACRARPQSAQLEVEMETGTGQRWQHIFFRSFAAAADGPVERIVALSKDIDNERSELSLFRQEYLKASMDDSLIVYAYDVEKGRLEELHRHADCFSAQEYYLTRTEELIHPEDLYHYRQHISPEVLVRAFAAGETFYTLWYRLKNRSGVWQWVKADVHLTRLSRTGSLGAFICISLTHDRDELKRRATYDVLTGVYNRATMEEKMAQALRVCPQSVFLLYDLDEFKQVNDTCGHQQGDVLLHGIAAIFTKRFRSLDILGRMGGDEFAVLLCGAPPDMPLKHLAEESLREIVALPEKLGIPCQISASLGIALAPQHGQTFTELYRSADAALYAAKAQGKNCYAIAGQLAEKGAQQD